MNATMEQTNSGALTSAATAPLAPLEWHPCLPNLTREDLLWFERVPDGSDTYYEMVEAARAVHGFTEREPTGAFLYAKLVEDRERRIKLAEDDPLYHGFKLDVWKIADEQLADPELDLQVNFGWNRGGGKTRRALRLLCEAAREYPANGDAGYLVLGETEDSLKFVQMPVVWLYLRKYIKALNGKQTGPYRVTHKPGTGFTEGLVIIPSGPIRNQAGEIIGYSSTSNIWFDTYKGDPGKYEGREFGGRLRMIGRTPTGKGILDLAKRPDGSLIENVGVVADEGLSLNWLRMIKRRAPFRQAKTIWSYTPIKGITPAIKEVVGELEVETSAPADAHVKFRFFTPDVPGCPRGHMPVTGRCTMARTKAVYFHISPQAFNDYFQIVRDDCQGREQRYIERMAFGWSSDTVDRQFGTFGPWNVIKPEQLPAVRTDYLIVDPHDERPYFFIYVGVAPGLDPEKPDVYVWRDWPDRSRHGEWAVATERETSEESKKGWDGDRGPAQANLDLGYVGYKLLWKEIETVRPDGGARQSAATERDPKRRALQLRANKEGRPLRMEIFERIIDSRAGPRKQLEDHGQTCTVDKFAEEHTDPVTGEKLEAVDFKMADGSRHDWTLIRELLEVKRDEQGRIEKAPRLFVTEDCQQVIWALENFTGRAGDTGACKDPIDCIEYAARGDLIHVEDTSFACRSAREWGDVES